MSALEVGDETRNRGGGPAKGGWRERKNVTAFSTLKIPFSLSTLSLSCALSLSPTHLPPPAPESSKSEAKNAKKKLTLHGVEPWTSGL